MSKSIKTTTKAAAVATIALGLLLVGCGSDSEETKPAESTTTAAAESTTTAATTTEAPAAEIEVSDAWARKSPMKTTAGAAYMKITSPIDDALVGASVDASIAGMVEIHETVMAEDDSMKMQHVDKIDLPAGEAVELKPGGYHVMLMELADPLEVGTTFDVTLSFENAEDLVIPVEVREG